MVIPLAHDIGVPHVDPEPMPKTGDGSKGPSSLVLLAGVVVTLFVVAAAVWAGQRRTTSAAGEATADGGQSPTPRESPDPGLTL